MATHQMILTSREVQLYLNATTDHKLIQWMNPYTGEAVPIMHIANDPAQSTFAIDGFSIDGYLTSANQVVLSIAVNLSYSNPLYDNET